MSDDAAGGFDDDLAGLFEDHRVNAVLAWLVIGAVVASAATELALADLTSALFAVVVAGLAVLPAVAYRNPRIMLPWEVLVLAALPVLGRLFATVPITEALATYLAVAAVALVVAVELHVFTAVRMTLGFAILSVVVFTMAAAGAWAVVRWAIFGPTFVASNEALMIEFVYSILAGVLAAFVFEFYVRRTANLDRLPPEVSRR
ncbi:hypothetical protein G9C85_03340 [Halorubellus sp. JP-L1]|uniref:hypothetical protein n=1 Tax=Halorubellus sp. JP-L1 TaxID=2715753 RepID=UPI001408BCE6|nr:hypothetical protein [Halorubellus sp. JP-L1]NHN40671.1 hypothetical protein [Halorubellus sp. JP-L1]